MKVLMINGSPRQHGCTDTALREVAKTLEKHGIESEIYWIGTKPVQGCMACNQCVKLGRCVVNDDVNALAGRFDEFGGLVIGISEPALLLHSQRKACRQARCRCCFLPPRWCNGYF